jgi:hypothetical protein
MNISNMLSSNYEVLPLGNSLQIITPMTFAHDGEHISIYANPVDNGWRLSDGGNAAMHTASRGIKLTSSRMKQVADIMPTVSVHNWMLESFADESHFAQSITDLMAAQHAISVMATEWKPANIKASKAIIDAVGETLKSGYGEKVKKDVPITGASGHQFTLPFVVETQNPMYIDTITGHWTSIHYSLGRMADLKMLSPESNRFIVIDEQAESFEQAATLLTDYATIIPFSRRSALLAA